MWQNRKGAQSLWDGTQQMMREQVHFDYSWEGGEEQNMTVKESNVRIDSKKWELEQRGVINELVRGKKRKRRKYFCIKSENMHSYLIESTKAVKPYRMLRSQQNGEISYSGSAVAYEQKKSYTWEVVIHFLPVMGFFFPTSDTGPRQTQNLKSQAQHLTCSCISYIPKGKREK